MYIVYERRDGQVAISTLAEGADVEDVVKSFREAHPKEFPKYTVFEQLEVVPKDRSNRDKWILKNGRIVENI